MFPRIAVVLAFTVLPALGADWNPRLAAQYLDSRQKEWFVWPRASTPEGPCLSCHTGMTYLLARPALRRALGESQPTAYEKGLLDALRARVAKKDPQELAKDLAKEQPSQRLGVEAVFSAFFLTREDSGTMSEETERAFAQLWSLQLRDGQPKGAWAWFSLKQDPWEMPDSRYFGAAIAALAAGSAPAEYRERPAIRERVHALTDYLERARESQPLHHRLALLWASSKLPAALPQPLRRPLIDEVLRQQQPDGGWTNESLGPWPEHPEAPPATGTSNYATAFVAFVLQEGGVPRSHPGLLRALDWLKSHQDRQSGFWAADSMNRRYQDSMPARFMQDAATAFATLSLLGAAR